MALVELNDKMGSRSLRHLNCFVAQVGDEQIISEFKGDTIPGVLTVVRKDYCKNGKWSHTTWQVEPAEGVTIFTIGQDWETGKYLNSSRWKEALEEFKTKVRFESEKVALDVAAIERYMRSSWPKTTAFLDSTAVPVDGSAVLAELLSAQKELAAISAEVARKEVEEKTKQEAEETKQIVAAAKAAMKKGVSLADLKSLLNQE